MIQLALGAIYSWSAFTTPLQGTDDIVSQFGFLTTDTQAIFSAGLATFAIFTIIGGRLAKKYGPRKIAMLGGVVLGAGYILGGLVGASFPLKLLTIGFLGGAGIGLAYVVPIAVGVRWFPDKKGLVSGLAVAGFGFGAFIWILMADPPNILGIQGLIQISNIGGIQTYTVANVDGVFMFYGIAFFTLVMIGSSVMKNPPAGWAPEGWSPPEEKDANGVKKKLISLMPKEMLRTPQFWLLWFMFAFGALAGLMVIGNVQNFARSPTDGFQAFGFSVDEAKDFAVIGAAVCLPILNGAGRIVWGQVSDRIGRKKALTSMFLLQGLMMTAFFYTSNNPYVFYLVAAMIGFNFGGNFALFAAATADSFGSEHVGLNYGYVFTSYGIGGIAGPILAGAVRDANMSFLYAFIPAAALCFIASFLAMVYKPQVKAASEDVAQGS